MQGFINGQLRTTISKVLLDIVYKVRATNNRYNLVYPFYLNEASNVSA